MYFTAWATLAVLGVYMWTGLNVARARVRYKVPAPAMDGPLGFQSVMRVQANTLEQLPMVLPPMWCVGRILYALGYYRDPAKREVGFVTAMAASALLILGTVIGLLLH
jgi:glutathione S-transferase